VTGANAGYSATNKPLIKALVKHVDTLEMHLPRQAAAGWVYATVLAAWAEDHGLTTQHLRADAAGRRKQHRAGGGTDATWIRRAYAGLGAHPSTACLLDPRHTALTVADPTEAPLTELLDWWADEAPDLNRREDGPGPDSITGWLIGDLLEGLHGDRIAGNAFCQTPWWIADFLCEHTVAPAAAFPVPTVQVIDPAAGTGHLLVWAALGLHQIYTAGRPGRPAVGPRAAVRRIVNGVHGVELDPLTAAVARLRLTVLGGVLIGDRPPGRLRLHEIPAWVRPRIAVGNALLAGRGDPKPPGTILDDTADYPGILDHGTYHAVVANPPYKVIKDPVTREAVRAAYKDVCSGKFPASVAFTRLLFDLAVRGGEDRPAGLTAEPEQFGLFDLVAAS
jgi:hypothetical protein